MNMETLRNNLIRPLPFAGRLHAIGGRLASLRAIGLIILTFGLSGCQFAPKSKAWSWPWSKNADNKPIPDRMLPIWTDTVLHQPNQPGLRGFGGRVFFYRDGNPEPIEVDGALAVYVFDADQLSPQQPNPEKKFVFTAEQFAGHMSHSSMGPSYSVWLPWDEVGGPNRKLSLVARFEGANGGTVISEPTIKLLPGVGSTASTVGKSPNSSNVQQASFSESHTQEERPESSGRKKSRKTVETIELPPSFQRHWQLPEETPNQAPIEASSNVQDSEVLSMLQSNQEQHSTPELHAQAPERLYETETKVYDYRTRRYPARTLGENHLPDQAELTSDRSTSQRAVHDSSPDNTPDHSPSLAMAGNANTSRSRWNGQKRMFRETPNSAGWIPSLPRTPR